MLTVGTPTVFPGYEDHGTAVIGEIAARNNNFGVTGIAFDADMYFSHTYINGIVNVSTAIFRCVAAFDPGDIILIEQQTWGPNSVGFPPDCFGCVPVEWVFANYNAIRIAIGNGITVVQAGANGSQNLDAAIYSQGNNGHWPFLPANNSGSILTGAGYAPSNFSGTGPVRTRMWYSNYGSRIDLQGWGESIYTSGYGDLFWSLGYNNYYTRDFGGTSGASPIVVGAAALVQSYHREQLGVALLPSELRELLKSTGTPQPLPNATSFRIGPQPNVIAAIEAIVIPTPCPCDTDNDGQQTVADYFTFLTNFFAQLNGPGSADFDEDGTVTVSDYFAFLSCLPALALSQPCD